MDEKELKTKLKEFDDKLAVLAGEVEDLEYDAEALSKKRRAFARRNCKHPRTYRRSTMGGEVDIYCDICSEAL